jgi:Replication-relaxation
MSAPYLTAARLTELDAQLSQRDQAILCRVSSLRFVSGAQLGRMHFDGVPARTTREALRRLARLDVLERLERAVGGVRAGSSGYVYRLGSAGQNLAASHGWQPADRNWRGHVPGTLFVAHALQVAELHTRLVETERTGRFEVIELQAEPACWRRYGGPLGPRVLKPDSFVLLGAGDFEDSYFIEVDMGTEGSRALLAKLRQYAEYETSGVERAERGVFPLCLWLTPDARRAEVIEGCIERLPQVSRELFEVAEFNRAINVMTGEGANR